MIFLKEIVDTRFKAANNMGILRREAMSIQHEINSFEFESITHNEAEKIKTGFFDSNSHFDLDEAIDVWVERAEQLNEVLMDIEDNPSSLREVMALLSPFRDQSNRDSVAIFAARNIEQVQSFYLEDQFIISLIEVIYNNIDNDFEVDSFIKECIELCEIIADTLNQ